MQGIISNLSNLYTNTFWVGNNNWDVKIRLAPLSVKFLSIHLILYSLVFPTPSIIFSFLIQFLSSISATLSLSIFVSLTLEMAMVSGNRAEREGG